MCVIKGEILKKEVFTLRTAWKEDEKARREEHEADKTKPLRNHVLGGGFRSVVAKVLFELLQREPEARMNQVEQQATTYLALLDVASLDAAIFRARLRRPEPKVDRAWGVRLLDARKKTKRRSTWPRRRSACSTMPRCSSQPQRSQDGPVAKWLRDLRGRNTAQDAGADDVDEDMSADNTKRPRRR